MFKKLKKLFGVVARKEPYPRLIKHSHSGPFNLKHKYRPLKRYRDLFHIVLARPWWELFLYSTALRFVIHVIFALLFYADKAGIVTGTDQEANFFDCFFLSVQTYETIGYGRLNPGSNYASIIVCIESYLAAFLTAAFAGLIVMKVARPSRQRKSILWSDVAVINRKERYWEGSCDAVQDGYYRFSDPKASKGYQAGEQGVPCLVFRLVNMRSAQICSPVFSLLLIRREYEDQTDTHDILEAEAQDGELKSSNRKEWKPRRLVRRINELNFELNTQVGRIRSNDTSNPFLPLPWTIVHAMNKDSPLYGATPESLLQSQSEIIGILDGLYADSGNQFQARCSYTLKDIIWDAAFDDCCFVNSKGRYVIDYRKFSAYQRLESEEKIDNARDEEERSSSSEEV